MIELAPIGDPDAVADAIAAALELPDSDVDALTRVRQHCEGKDMLLVLDNCEHLVDAAARVAEELLGACEDVRILATSREALRVTGEAVWPVPPLDEGDAVELFIQRATSADPAFVVDDAARSIIRDICDRLDGLPLAIELAAARTRAFTVAQIAERLDDRFRLLTGGSRTAMARQQTLRAVVDWSYDLLFEDERRVFERLSVFPGGCLIGAAEAVCAGDDVDDADVVELIGGLVEKSLLLVDRSGSEPRYRMLQTLSQYGRERLVERGEADAVFGRMAAHFAELCARSARLPGVDQRQWYMAIAAEQDNIRTAFDWAVGAGEKELAVAIAADIALSRWVTGGAREGYRWLDTALALPGDVTPFTYGRALVWRAFLGHITALGDHIDEQFDEGIALLREHADAVLVGHALTFYAQVVGETGRSQQATELNVAAVEQFGGGARGVPGRMRPNLVASPDRRPGARRLRDLPAAVARGPGPVPSRRRFVHERRLPRPGCRVRRVPRRLRGRDRRAARSPRHDRGFADGSLRGRAHGAARHGRGDVGRPRGSRGALATRVDPRRRAVGPARARPGAERAGEPPAPPGAARRSGARRARRAGAVPRRGRTQVLELVLARVVALRRARGRGGVVVGARLRRRGTRRRGARDRMPPRRVRAGVHGAASAPRRSRSKGSRPPRRSRATVWAAQLLGCVDRMRSERRAVRAPSEQVDVDRAQDAATALLGRSAFAAAYEQGRFVAR